MTRQHYHPCDSAACEKWAVLRNVYVASVSVGGHTFTATGTTHAFAVDALLDAWRTHADQTYADPDLITEADMHVVAVPFNGATRDDVPVP